jgi:hypothetical protein
VHAQFLSAEAGPCPVGREVLRELPTQGAASQNAVSGDEALNPEMGWLAAKCAGASILLVALWRVGRVIKRIAGPFREFLVEHDVLWEDYNIRTGGTYRRRTGRGDPPEPEDFYRKHQIEDPHF